MMTAKYLRFALIFMAFLALSCSSDDSSDEPQTETVEITVSDFEATMDENPSANQVIGTLDASTNQGTLTFSLVQENPAGALVLSDSGILSVADLSVFDYETNSTITATVEVSNGAVSDSIDVVITLADISENIFVGDVQLTTQEEINDFAAMDYVEITGNLIIGDEFDINTSVVDLTPLEELRVVGGSFEIYRNEALETIDGLGVLHTIGSSVIIRYNDNLERIWGFDSLTEVFDLIITHNTLVSDIQGFSQVRRIIEDLHIVFIDELTNIDSLSNITEVGSTVLIGANESLTSIAGLQNISSSLEYLFLIENKLQNLNGLQNIGPEISEVMAISTENEISNLDEINHLTFVNQIQLNNNSNLTNLDGLSNINAANSIEIIDNQGLTDFCGLENFFVEGNYDSYDFTGNAYNPTAEDIVNGDCSL